MTRILKDIASVGAAGAVFVLGLAAGAPEAGADKAGGRQLGAPTRVVDGSDEVALGEGLQVFGQPARMTVFWTSDTSQQVADHYVATWEAAELKPMVRVVDRVTSVSAVDPRSGLMRSVTIMDSGDERLVVPSTTDVRTVPDTSPRGAPVPVPENAQAYIGNVSDDAVSVTFHATFVVPLTPEQVLRFYRRELEGAGYAVEKDSERAAEGARSIDFSRGPEAITVVASPTEDDKRNDGKVASFTVVTHTRAIPMDDAPAAQEVP